jgi:hypothetical protein
MIQVATPAGADRTDIEGRIREKMKYYATPFSVEWSTDGA